MSRNDGKIMFVLDSVVLDSPQAFQDYVEKYFDSTEIGGVKCYFAFLTSNGDMTRDHSQIKKKGVAPSLMFYLSAEIDKNTSLFDWLSKKCDDPKSGIVILSRSWEDGCY